MRITYLATIIFVLPAALVATWFGAREVFGQVAWWVLGLLAPIMVAGIVGTFRPWMPRWMGLVSMVSNAVAGCLFVVFAFHVMHRPDFAMAATIITGCIAFSVLRLQVAEAILAALPYFVIHGVLMARSDEASGNVVAYASLDLIALAIGTVVAWTIGRTSRESYRQSRTIEAQQQLIDRERDRAAELRERECSCARKVASSRR